MKNLVNPNETAPLLEFSREHNLDVEKKRPWMCWKVISLGIITVFYSIFLVVAVISIVYVKPRLQDGVTQGASFDLKSFKLLGLNNDEDQSGGLLLDVKGQEDNHFDRIDDSILKHWFVYGGLFIRGLELNIIDVTMMYVSQTEELVDLGKARVDPFYVHTFNNRATSLDLIVEYWPNSNGVGSILKQVTSHPFTKINFKVHAVVEVYLINGIIGIGTIQVPLDLAFDPQEMNLLDLLNFIEQK